MRVSGSVKKHLKNVDRPRTAVSRGRPPIIQTTGEHCKVRKNSAIGTIISGIARDKQSKIDAHFACFESIGTENYTKQHLATEPRRYNGGIRKPMPLPSPENA